MIESTKSLSLYDLQKKAEQAKLALDSIEFAALLDKEDELSLLREEFHIPKQDDRESIYLVGNSLGLQPKSLKGLLDEELRVWADSAVNGHFDHAYKRPWLTVDEECASHLCNIVGAKEGEVAAMGTLTTNLHLLMCAFYHPTLRRYKIVLEKRAFPSDHYLVESQLKLHGIDPKDGMILVAPREGEDTIQTDDILATLRQHGDSVAIVLFAGVQYYTGQHFDIPTISKAGHEIGAIVGIDLAHAVGNVPLEVHDWNVDFAAWCSYKYLNSGPGAIAGLFVHNRHDQNDNLTILRGWWSHQVSTRFRMDNKFEAIVGAYWPVFASFPRPA
jgi:kynureninase